MKEPTDSWITFHQTLGKESDLPFVLINLSIIRIPIISTLCRDIWQQIRNYTPGLLKNSRKLLHWKMWRLKLRIYLIHIAAIENIFNMRIKPTMKRVFLLLLFQLRGISSITDSKNTQSLILLLTMKTLEETSSF